VQEKKQWKKDQGEGRQLGEGGGASGFNKHVPEIPVGSGVGSRKEFWKKGKDIKKGKWRGRL